MGGFDTRHLSDEVTMDTNTIVDFYINCYKIRFYSPIKKVHFLTKKRNLLFKNYIHYNTTL